MIHSVNLRPTVKLSEIEMNEWMNELKKSKDGTPVRSPDTTLLPQRYTHKVGFCGLLLLLLLVASPLTVVGGDRERPGLQDILDSTRILQLLFFMFKYYLTKKVVHCTMLKSQNILPLPMGIKPISSPY